MSRIVMTEAQYVERLRILADRKTKYNNRYPYNLLYNMPTGETTGDCLNTIKALFNGYDVNNRTVGYYQRDLSNTGDITEIQLLNTCSGVSSDFSRISGSVKILYMKGHVGTYLNAVINGKYNVIECTKSFGGGIVYSWVDPDGTRRKEKGGTKNGKWLKYGKPDKFVEFPKNETGKPIDTDYSKYPILKMNSRGEWVKVLQRLLLNKGYDCKGIDGIWGKNTEAAVRKFQKENKDTDGKPLVVDGYVGPKTWGALYK